jgi:Asp-tRNA(Asn)/Glu-tRNA(Gln) amidotransferase A subunit family amidase
MHPGINASLAAIQAGTATGEALVSAQLARIAATDGDVHAWAHLDGDAALEATRTCDRGRGEGAVARAPGKAAALDGIAIGVKDIIDVAGMPTTCGSPLFAGAVAAADAACVASLRRAGACVLGKTVTTEFAYMRPAPTRNPWNAAHTPGGSSSGSAAAVALGHVPAALATQTNGSVIRPAAFCGVVGFKPSFGTIRVDGVALFSPSFDTVGVMARSVEDCAVVAAAMAEPDRIAAQVAAPAQPPRLALLTRLPWVGVDDEQLAAIERGMKTLAAAGARVERVELPVALHEVARVHRCIMLREGADRWGALQERERARMSRELNEGLDAGRAFDAATVTEAREAHAAMRRAGDEWLGSFDALVAAPAPGEAPRGLDHTGNPGWCTLASLLGVPAIALPVASSQAGLPLGVQLIAAANRDDALLSIARWCEQRFAWQGLS